MDKRNRMPKKLKLRAYTAPEFPWFTSSKVNVKTNETDSRDSRKREFSV